MFLLLLLLCLKLYLRVVVSQKQVVIAFAMHVFLTGVRTVEDLGAKCASLSSTMESLQEQQVVYDRRLVALQEEQRSLEAELAQLEFGVVPDEANEDEAEEEVACVHCIQLNCVDYVFMTIFVGVFEPLK